MLCCFGIKVQALALVECYMDHRPTFSKSLLFKVVNGCAYFVIVVCSACVLR